MGKERRPFAELCMRTLKALNRPKNINEVAQDIKAGWTTCESCLEFLEKLGHVEKVVSRPMRIYKRAHVVRVPDRFINELQLITERKGTRHHTLEECLHDALREFIHQEKNIKRY